MDMEGESYLYSMLIFVIFDGILVDMLTSNSLPKLNFLYYFLISVF